MCTVWRRLQRDALTSSDTAGSSDCGFPRDAPFGVPVVPEVRITTRPSRDGRDHVVAVALLDQVVEGGVGGALGVVPGHEALAPLAGLREQPGELLVVDDRRPASRA